MSALALNKGFKWINKNKALAKGQIFMEMVEIYLFIPLKNRYHLNKKCYVVAS